MQKRHLIGAALALASLSAVHVQSFAADAYPVHEPKLVIPFAPGGATDFVFRLYAEAAAPTFGKSIVPMNMGGAGGSKGSTAVFNAPADGYTLLAGHEFMLTTHYAGMVKFSVDDFDAVAMLTKTPMVVGARADAPYNNVKEFIAYIKANPGKVVVAMTPASIQTVFWNMLCEKAGIDSDKDYKTVIINGNGPQVKAMLGKHVDCALGDIPSFGAYFKENRLKPIGVAYEKRLDVIPNAPTFKESGFDVTMAVTRAIFVKKGTPQVAIDKLEKAFAVAANNKDVVKRVSELGNECVFANAKATKAYFNSLKASFKAGIEKK